MLSSLCMFVYSTITYTEPIFVNDNRFILIAQVTLATYIYENILRSPDKTF